MHRMTIHFGLATLIQTSHYATIMRKKPVVFQTHYVLYKLMTHNPKREIGEKLETALNNLPEVI